MTERDWRVLAAATWGEMPALLREDPRWGPLLKRIGIKDVVDPLKPLGEE